MRTHFIFVVVVIVLTGCSHSNRTRSSVPADLGASVDPTVIGTWLFHYAGDEKETRIELSEDGGWRWWPPSDGASPLEGPTQSGTWFIHQRVFVLRIKQSESDKIPAGIAFTYDVRKISPQSIILYDIFTKREFIWRRATSYEASGVKG